MNNTSNRNPEILSELHLVLQVTYFTLNEEQYEVFSVSFCGNIYILHDRVDGFCPRRLLIIWRSLFCNIHIPFSSSIKSLNKKKRGIWEDKYIRHRSRGCIYQQCNIAYQKLVSHIYTIPMITFTLQVYMLNSYHLNKISFSLHAY